MKLYYYQRRDGQPNFGDELNRWLWPKLLPNFFAPQSDSISGDISDDTSDSIFVGTGTLLNERLPERLQEASRVVILGTGAGYERPLRSIPKHWTIYSVRGPLSVRQLNLPPEKAAADGGILINRVFPTDLPKQYPVSFIPHIHHANYADEQWQSICYAAHIHYIDPRWTVENVLTEIGKSQLVLAEAMHGAIAADALRVPWIPLVTSPRILAFKWQDWCQSMELSYRPQIIPPLFAYPRWGQGIRSGLTAAAHWGKSTGQDIQTGTQYLLNAREETITRRLVKVMETIEPSLSRSQVLSTRLAQLKSQLEIISA